MKNLLLIFIATFSFIALSSSSATAQWTKVGDRTVGFVADHDEILVTAWKGTYRKVKFACNKAPIHLHNIKIVYGNGEFTNIKVGRRIAAGTESRVFDLPGGKRIIKKIKFNYKSIPTFKGKAHIVAYARR